MDAQHLSGPITVLIVENHQWVLDSLVEGLSDFDEIKVIGTASNGVEAVELCDVLQPQVVLTDLHMPMMDGTTAAQIIREQHPEIQIIVLTGSFESTHKREIFESGALYYLEKSVTIAELAEVIQGL